MEQNTAYSRVRLDIAWDEQLDTDVPTLRIDNYLCPSEIHDQVRVNASGPYVYPQTYGFNFGSWLVYDPATGKDGDGAFYANSRLRPADYRDGLSNTLAAAEVKALPPTSATRPTPVRPSPTCPATYRLSPPGQASGSGRK